MTSPFPTRRATIDAALHDLREVSSPYAQDRFVTRPSVEPPALLRRLESACTDVFAGIDAVLRDVCGGDIARLGALCRATPEEISLLGHQPHQDWATIARPDVIISGGRTLVVEVNSDSPAGLFGLHDILARAQEQLLETGGDRPVAPSPALPALLKGVAGEIRRDDGLFAICYWAHERDEGPLSWQYDLFVAELARLGVEAVYCAVEDLEFGVDAVTYQGRPIGLVYRCFESPAQDNAREQEKLRVLFEAARDGIVGLFTGYRGETLASKAVLSVLTDEKIVGGIDTALAARVRRSVPWTRIVEPRETYRDERQVDLVPYLVAHREELLLKPVRGHGGRGVVIGREVDDAAWRALVERAAADGPSGSWWIAQELFVPDAVTVTHTDSALREITTETVSVDGCFIVDGTAVGVLRRYAINDNTTLNINPRSGYAASPVWWTAGTDSVGSVAERGR
ncbi:hypothetical protein [Streptomyces sp. NPDC050738]|uniref:hypothetical protein n=1 Tax=Streptomyces sp. NPDC050738 TaxID=3154744 RepID=UPI003418D8AE